MLKTKIYSFDKKNDRTVLYLDGYMNVFYEKTEHLLKKMAKELKNTNIIEIEAPHKVNQTHPFVLVRRLIFFEFFGRKRKTNGRMWFDFARTLTVKEMVKLLFSWKKKNKKDIIKTAKEMTDRMHPELDALSRKIDRTIKKLNLNPKKTIIVGYSQGGMIAEYYVDKGMFRPKALVSIAGVPVLSEKEKQRKTQRPVPFHLIYGEKDPLIMPELQKARKVRPNATEEVLKNTQHIITEKMVDQTIHWIKENERSKSA